MNRLACLLVLAALPGSVAPLDAQEAMPGARATFVNARGDSIGSAYLQETPSYGVLVRVSVSGLPAGPHAFHIHSVGRCEGEGFSESGGHYAPRGKAHGALHPEGKHGGDMLNLHVPPSGEVTSERLATEVTLRPGAEGTLFDGDGSALVIHSGSDDYRSQPSGNGGTPMACAVIRPIG